MDTCKHGIFGRCSYCWTEAEKMKEAELSALRTRLKALEEGMVVVWREDLHSALAAAVSQSDDFHESDAYKSLCASLEKKL